MATLSPTVMSSSNSKVGDEHDFRDQTVPQLISHFKSVVDSEFKKVESLLVSRENLWKRELEIQTDRNELAISRENLLKRELEIQTDRNKLAAQLEAILSIREEKLKHEIESKRNENEWIKQEHERERLEKAAEMERWKKEILELREKNTLREEVELQNSLLKSQIDCLESAKKKAEMEVTVLKKRVSDLEKGIPPADNIAIPETCIISFIQIHSLESAKDEAEKEVAVLKKSVRDLENKLSELVKGTSMLTNIEVLNEANEKPISMNWEPGARFVRNAAFYIITKSQVSSLESATNKAKMKATLLKTRVLDLEKQISKFEEVRICDSKGKRKRPSEGSPGPPGYGNASSKGFGQSSTKAAGTEDDELKRQAEEKEKHKEKGNEKGVSEKTNREMPKHCDPAGKSEFTKPTASHKPTTPAKRTKLSSSNPSSKTGNGSDSHQGMPKEKSTTTKQSFLSKENTRKTAAKGKEKAKLDNFPHYKDLKEAICDILKGVDFNTTKVGDIMKQVAMKFQIDIAEKKELIKCMINVEVKRIAEAEVARKKDKARN